MYSYKQGYRLKHVENTYFDHTKEFIKSIQEKCPNAQITIVEAGPNKADPVVLDLSLNDNTLRVTCLPFNGGERVETGPYSGWFVSVSQLVEILSTSKIACYPNPEKIEVRNDKR